MDTVTCLTLHKGPTIALPSTLNKKGGTSFAGKNIKRELINRSSLDVRITSGYQTTAPHSQQIPGPGTYPQDHSTVGWNATASIRSSSPVGSLSRADRFVEGDKVFSSFNSQTHSNHSGTAVSRSRSTPSASCRHPWSRVLRSTEVSL